MQVDFSIVPNFLKNPQDFYQRIQEEEGLRAKALSIFLSSLVFMVIYGFVTGLAHSWLQAVATAVKIPLLFLVTLAFTLPSLYFFALAQLNVKFSIVQAGLVVLAGIGVSAFLLLGLAPVTLFFDLTSSNYPFFQLLAVIFVAISGITGLFYILQGFNRVDTRDELRRNPLGRVILTAWMILYGFVGAQMTWRLSPFIGDPEQPFVLLQPSRDNFFIDVLNAFLRTFGLQRINSAFDLIGILFCAGFILLIVVAVGIWMGSRISNKAMRLSKSPEKVNNTPEG